MPFRVIPFRDRLLNRIVKRAPRVSVARGESVVQAGDDATHAVLLRDGVLHVRTRPEGTDPHGESRVVDLVLPWELAGMDAVVGEGRHRWTLAASEPASVQLLDGRGVRRVVRRAEGTFDAWQRAGGDRLELLRRTGPGATTPAARRLALVLTHLAGRAVDGEGPLELPVRVTHRILGEMAGIHRSTVTTLLNDWLYRDLVAALDPGWRIVDPEGLLEAGDPR